MTHRDWRTPTTWEQRFREALTVLCGEPPPNGAIEAWFQPGCDSSWLQHWAIDACKIPWAQGIVVIDAAALLADTPVEGEMHAYRVEPPCEHDWKLAQIAGDGRYCKKCGLNDYDFDD